MYSPYSKKPMQRKLSFERPPAISMTDEEFSRFRSLVYTSTHIYCPDTQKPLFERKIRLRLAALRLASFQDYYTLVTESKGKKQELSRLLDVMAVHETSFFRIAGHFFGLETRIFPELLRAASQPAIHVWSAGCSTGEEPYSLVITFLEALSRCGQTVSQTRRFHVLATDVSASVIEKARSGIYPPQKIKKIPQPFLDKYFDYGDHHYYIAQHVKDFVTFQVVNLINPEAFPAQKYDIIFCRNLLIYFDQPARITLLTGLTQCLVQGGYLFLGDAESLHLLPEIATHFELIETGDAICYQKRGVDTP